MQTPPASAARSAAGAVVKAMLAAADATGVLQGVASFRIAGQELVAWAVDPQWPHLGMVT